MFGGKGRLLVSGLWPSGGGGRTPFTSVGKAVVRTVYGGAPGSSNLKRWFRWQRPGSKNFRTVCERYKNKRHPFVGSPVTVTLPKREILHFDARQMRQIVNKHDDIDE